MVRGRLRRENRGVSPVISVVLLVAITVILAATAGYVVFGLADETKAVAPQPAITATYDRTTDGDGQALELVFEGGDTLEEKNVYFVLQDAVAVNPSGSDSAAEIDGNQIDAQIGSEIAAGATMTIDADATTVDTTSSPSEKLDLSDATLRLVWDPASADIQETETIWRWSDS
ncbi:flagellin N-terminal-like domain-containing protein [Halomicrobium zhouii]|uniref:Flagellin N-terminal-like domain-containing protein n=1 Tax=Halomicrobium zhouii TaxID=767519 RepID=A0A1I6KZ78_9EURY|nr:type IV pilin N-terminal domain-containing protein [Halomicrobium zhouii]SFR96529.1 flagellin N-terminal-like domain-containing protein [Halomicrobium zhouii]